MLGRKGTHTNLSKPGGNASALEEGRGPDLVSEAAPSRLPAAPVSRLTNAFARAFLKAIRLQVNEVES